MRTPCTGFPPIRLVGGSARGVARCAMPDACSEPCRADDLLRATHPDEVPARLSSGTYDTHAAAHALARVLLSRGEL